MSQFETESYTYTDSASCSVLSAAYQSMQGGTFGDDFDPGLDDDGILDRIYP